MHINKVHLIGKVENIQKTDTDDVVFLDIKTSIKIIKDSKKNIHTNYHKVVAFGNIAQSLLKIIKIGDDICVDGRIEAKKTGNVEDKNSISCVVIDKFQI